MHSTLMNATPTNHETYQSTLKSYVEETAACGRDISVADFREWAEEPAFDSLDDADIELDLFCELEGLQECPECRGEGGITRDAWDWRSECAIERHERCEHCDGSGTRYEDIRVTRVARAA